VHTHLHLYCIQLHTQQWRRLDVGKFAEVKESLRYKKYYQEDVIKLKKQKNLYKTGHKIGPGCLISGTVPENPGRMVILALICAIQYCVRSEWWLCMHVFQHPPVGVLRPIPAELSWNVALCSVLLGKFLLHIFVARYEWQLPRWCSLCWQKLCGRPAREWSFVMAVCFVLTNSMEIQDEIRRRINSETFIVIQNLAYCPKRMPTNWEFFFHLFVRL
jgi:hypothetical protein